MTGERQQTQASRRISRLDQWIVILALAWLGIGLTFLFEGSRDQHHAPGPYVT